LRENDGNLSLILEMNHTACCVAVVVVYIGHVTHYVTVCRLAVRIVFFRLDRKRYELRIREALHKKNFFFYVFVVSCSVFFLHF